MILAPPVAYRVTFRAARRDRGATPTIDVRILEGDPRFSI